MSESGPNISLFRFLIVCSCLIPAEGFTQEDSTYTADSTSIVAPPLEEEEDENNYFDTISIQGKFFPAYSIPDSAINRLRKDEDFWYANLSPKKENRVAEDQVKIKEPFYRKRWFKILVWSMIIASFIGVLIWFLVASDVRLFRRKAKSVEHEDEHSITDDIFSIHYENEINKAIEADNYRLSIRLFYLHILRLMADKEVIQYKPERTNSAYLGQLYGTGYYKNFFRLTRQFEYVWYGQFNPSTTVFETIREEYVQLKDSLA